MKKFLLVLVISGLVVSGCAKKPPVPSDEEVNETPTEEADVAGRFVDYDALVMEKDTYINKAVAEGSIKVCESVTDPNFRQECYFSVLTDTSYKGSAKECKILSVSFLREGCEAHYAR